MISSKPWSLDAAARLFFGVIMSLCAGALVAGSLGGLKLPAAQIQFAQFVVMVLAFQGAALVWISYFLRQSQIGWRDAFGLRPASIAKTMGLGLLAGILVLPIAAGLQLISVTIMEKLQWAPVDQTIVEQLKGTGLSISEKVIMGMAAILFVPVVEEMLFRGVMYPTIKQRGYPRAALWGTSFLFALMHANAASFLPLVFLAVVFTYLYERTNSLLAPIAAHAVFNAANFLFLVLSPLLPQAPFK